jgi:hypothetical protein
MSASFTKTPISLHPAFDSLLPSNHWEYLLGSCLGFGKRNVNTFLEPSSDSRIELPGNIDSTQNQNLSILFAHSVHLYKKSVLTRRRLSLSPSLRLPHKLSTSSMKMMALPFSDSRAISNKFRTSRSLSPCHLEIKSALLTEKKVESASVATAFAKYDFPVPGGPYNRMPLKGLRLPVNN